MDGYAAYQKYIAIKNHFTKETYDYFKYNGKANIKQATFEARKDKFMFHKLAKKKDIEGFLVSNFIERESTWVKDLLNIEADQIYSEWIKRQQSLTYIFEQDIEKLDEDFNKNIQVKDNEYPHLLKLFMRKQISIETMIIINSIVGFFQYWNKQIIDPVIWPSIYMKCTKYSPFLKFDKQKYKDLLIFKFK